MRRRTRNQVLDSSPPDITLECNGGEEAPTLRRIAVSGVESQVLVGHDREAISEFTTETYRENKMIKVTRAESQVLIILVSYQCRQRFFIFIRWRLYVG
jgi:hypothetical protein